MYFFTDEEKEKLKTFFLPKSRENNVSEELRGWMWTQPPLEPIYDLKLTVSEVSSRYCPTGRDLFLKKVSRLTLPPNEAMVSGSFYHASLCEFATTAKKYIYLGGSNSDYVLKGIGNNLPQILENQLAKIETVPLKEKLKINGKLLLEYEFRAFSSRYQDIISRQPKLGPDALAFNVLPVVVEQKIDGSRLGLSPYLSCDAVFSLEPIIFDIKFGSKRDFHFLGPTGYALVFESIFNYPINLCCVVYVSFFQGQIKIEKEFKLLSDEVRMEFIEERDQKMRMIYEEIDPGVPDNCSFYCPFVKDCQTK